MASSDGVAGIVRPCRHYRPYTVKAQTRIGAGIETCHPRLQIEQFRLKTRVSGETAHDKLDEPWSELVR